MLGGEGHRGGESEDACADHGDVGVSHADGLSLIRMLDDCWA